MICVRAEVTFACYTQALVSRNVLSYYLLRQPNNWICGQTISWRGPKGVPPRAFLVSYTYHDELTVANKYSTMNVQMNRQLSAKWKKRQKQRKRGRKREKKGEKCQRERIIVRDERMKFTELHIAVVTFHPCKIYFPLSRSFCRMHFSRVTRKVGRREKREKETECEKT